MSNIIVVYRSKTGFVKNYAEWIAKAVGADLREAKGVEITDLMKYDTIVYGGGLYAGGINGFRLIKKNLDQLKGKRLIVFTSGASPVRPEVVDEVKKHNLNPEEQKQVQFFMMRGGFNYNKLSPIDKFLMSLRKIQLKSIKNPDADARGMLAAYSQPVDFTREKNIEPVVKAILAK
ncbi:flavodoxin domain-containing protein [Acetanaerobacterium elongatum]|uniref:Protoporphyrinogen IX oxidase, menaquinone-dependent (Flavodoxin domain) n=1 Tax=Acetanaerobacterium elongatum TaxID=258515 RepID=A0A1H0A6F3_9FIRM|nr:flavodoxin domain-containing protein [Acetanaerobacterium elongatum]SDN29120.1 Protoporphyrinogen IX oxidase, menaquinone-dependent (flavodoxin domain) [Acetanaerobacterium elongatum]